MMNWKIDIGFDSPLREVQPFHEHFDEIINTTCSLKDELLQLTFQEPHLTLSPNCIQLRP